MDTILLKDAGLIFIGGGLIILIIYCIAFMKNLVQTVKHSNKILEDAKTITGIAAARAKDVDKVIDDVAASAGSVSKIIKGNQSTIGALTAIVNSLMSLQNLLRKQKK